MQFPTCGKDTFPNNLESVSRATAHRHDRYNILRRHPYSGKIKILMRRQDLLILIVMACCIAANFANTSFAAHDTKEGELAPISAGPITTWTAPLCGRGRLAVQPFFFYNRARGAFDAEGHYKAYKDKETKSQYQEQLFMQYGLTNRLEVAAQGVYQQNLHHKDGNSANATGFGDSYIFGRYCIIEEQGWFPHTSALFQLKIPTGKYDKLKTSKLNTDFMGADTGGGSYDHGYGFNLTKKIKPFVTTLFQKGTWLE